MADRRDSDASGGRNNAPTRPDIDPDGRDPSAPDRPSDRYSGASGASGQDGATGDSGGATGQQEPPEELIQSAVWWTGWQLQSARIDSVTSPAGFYSATAQLDGAYVVRLEYDAGTGQLTTTTGQITDLASHTGDFYDVLQPDNAGYLNAVVATVETPGNEIELSFGNMDVFHIDVQSGSPDNSGGI